MYWDLDEQPHADAMSDQGTKEPSDDAARESSPKAKTKGAAKPKAKNAPAKAASKANPPRMKRGVLQSRGHAAEASTTAQNKPNSAVQGTRGFRAKVNDIMADYEALCSENASLMNEISALRRQLSARGITGGVGAPRAEEDEISSMSGGGHGWPSNCDDEPEEPVSEVEKPGGARQLRLLPAEEPSAPPTEEAKETHGEAPPSEAPPEEIKEVRFSPSRASQHTVEIASITFPEWSPSDGLGLTVDHRAQELIQMFEDEPESDACVISPVGTNRIAWDVFMLVCVIVAMWNTTFESAYMEELPRPLKIADDSITILFLVDMALNFNTGFVDKDRIIMQRGPIISNYMKAWFWSDLIATVPWKRIMQKNEGGLLYVVRFMKASRYLRTLRFLRMLRTVRLLRSLQRQFSLVGPMKMLIAPACFMILMLGIVHIHACILTALQPNWTYQADVSTAFNVYFDSFVQCYTAFTLGTEIEIRGNDESMSGDLSSEGTPKLWTFQLAVATERVLMLMAVAAWGVYRVLIFVEEDSKMTVVKEDSLTYMRDRQVSADVQLEVLHCLNETNKAQSSRKHFRQLISENLPVELKRTICYELWAPRLLTLGLIMHIAELEDDFVVDLAEVVREDTFASKSAVFRQGDLSSAAYFVVRGSIMLKSSNDKEPIPDFTEGCWLGERALMDPKARRSLTAVSRTTSTLMAVPADVFQSLLQLYSLQDRFKAFAKKALAGGGICGRCGLVGDHFADACPALQSSKSNFLQRVIHSIAPGAKFMPKGLYIPCITETMGDENYTPLLEEMPEDVPAVSSIEAPEEPEEPLRLFMSHHGAQSDRSANVLRSGLEGLVGEDQQENLVFQNGADLDPHQLRNRLLGSQVMLLLLTPGVLSHPRALVEVVEACEANVIVVCVEVVQKGTLNFQPPDDSFYEALSGEVPSGPSGDTNQALAAMRCADALTALGIESRRAEEALRKIFRRDPVQFAPQKPLHVRQAQLQAIFLAIRSSVNRSDERRPSQVHPIMINGIDERTTHMALD